MANQRLFGRRRAAIRRVGLWVCLALAGWHSPHLAWGQSPAEGDGEAVSVGRATGLTASPTGWQRYTPGRWGGVGVQGMNQSDEDTRATVAVYFGEETQHQFARRFWIPAHARRTTWLPVRPPSKLDAQRRSWDMSIMPLEESATGEVVKRREGDELLPNRPLQADIDGIKTAARFRRFSPDSRGRVPDPDDDIYELMAVAKEMAGVNRVVVGLADQFAPPHPNMWESLDQFIIVGDDMLEDSAGLAALRGWLFDGGRLCVFLDRTRPETVATILGHGDTLQVVDRVQLDEFVIEEVTAPRGGGRRDRRRFEQPIDFVRVTADNVEVQCHVGGWPAAFWQRAGDGEVLFITLAASGWRPASTRPDCPPAPEHLDPEFRSTNALHAVAARFYGSRSRTPTLADATRPLLQQQIGYRIPGRGLAVSLLGGNLALLIAGGVWLARRNQLAHIAWLAPTLSVVTTSCFLVTGVRNSRSVPSSAVFAQWVRYQPDVDMATLSGTAAIYQQTTSSLDLTAGPQGLLSPAARPTEGTMHRLLWDDDDAGRWLNVSTAAGSVQFATFDQTRSLPRHVFATAQFTAEGLVGRLPAGLLEQPTDALIAALPAPALVVRPDTEGSFVGRASDVLPQDQFLGSTVVSDESRRRQDIYRHLFASRDESVSHSVPAFFAWTRSSLNALRVPDGLAQQGTTLSSFPLQISPTPSGAEFRVPATFIRMQSVQGPKGKSLAFNERKGRWITDSSRASTTRLRFGLPPQVLPCQLTDALLTIKLNAPSRSVVLTAVAGEKEQLIREIENPNRVYEIPLDRPEWLTLDRDGGLVVDLVITPSEQERRQQAASSGSPRPEPSTPGQSPEAERPGSFTTWEVNYVRLDVHGQTN